MQVYLGSDDGKLVPLGDVYYLDDVNSEQVECASSLVINRYWI